MKPRAGGRLDVSAFQLPLGFITRRGEEVKVEKKNTERGVEWKQ